MFNEPLSCDKKICQAQMKLRRTPNLIEVCIVTGRYSQNRVDRALRLCTLCNGSHIEDEYHFVAICPAYNQLREKYIRPYYYKRPSVYKFTLLMRSTNTTIVKNLAKFVSEAFSFRNTLVN